MEKDYEMKKMEAEKYLRDKEMWDQRFKDGEK
jgi:hypothetical protein